MLNQLENKMSCDNCIIISQFSVKLDNTFKAWGDKFSKVIYESDASSTIHVLWWCNSSMFHTNIYHIIIALPVI